MNDFNPKISFIGTAIMSFIVILFVIQGLPALTANGTVVLAGQCVVGGGVVFFWGMVAIKLYAMFVQDTAQLPKKRATPVKRMPRMKED
jgi:hypothetical protein